MENGDLKMIFNAATNNLMELVNERQDSPPTFLDAFGALWTSISARTTGFQRYSGLWQLPTTAGALILGQSTQHFMVFLLPHFFIMSFTFFSLVLFLLYETVVRVVLQEVEDVEKEFVVKLTLFRPKT